MKSLLDANILIEANNYYFRFDLCPDFWKWIKSYDKMKSVFPVREEMLAREDKLAQWIKDELAPSYFLEMDVEIQKNYRRIVDYIDRSIFKQSGKDKFLKGADGWLIATAMSKKETIIVSNENSNPESRKKIYLPDVANHFGVRCMNIFQILFEEGITLSFNHHK